MHSSPLTPFKERKEGSLNQLLAGKESGTSLFLGWCLGLPIYLVKVLADASSDNFYVRMSAFLGCMLLMSIWQGILLLSSAWRRMAWGLVFAAGVSPLMSAEIVLSDKLSYWSCLLVVMCVQGFLLAGMRKRFWLWVVLAVMGNPLLSTFEIRFSQLYDEFWVKYGSLFAPREMGPSPDDVYGLLLSVAFGLLAAFLMPPNQPSDVPA